MADTPESRRCAPESKKVVTRLILDKSAILE